MASVSRAPNPHIRRDNADGRWQAAIDAFLSRPDFGPETRRYGPTFGFVSTAAK